MTFDHDEVINPSLVGTANTVPDSRSLVAFTPSTVMVAPCRIDVASSRGILAFERWIRDGIAHDDVEK